MRPAHRKPRRSLGGCARTRSFSFEASSSISNLRASVDSRSLDSSFTQRSISWAARRPAKHLQESREAQRNGESTFVAAAPNAAAAALDADLAVPTSELKMGQSPQLSRSV